MSLAEEARKVTDKAIAESILGDQTLRERVLEAASKGECSIQISVKHILPWPQRMKTIDELKEAAKSEGLVAEAKYTHDYHHVTISW